MPFVISPQEQAVRALDPRNAFRFAQKHSNTHTHTHTQTHTHPQTQTRTHTDTQPSYSTPRLDLSALLSVGHPASWRHVWLKFQWQINKRRKQCKKNNKNPPTNKTQTTRDGIRHVLFSYLLVLFNIFLHVLHVFFKKSKLNEFTLEFRLGLKRHSK